MCQSVLLDKKIIGDALGRQEEYGLVSSENLGVGKFGEVRRQI